MNSDYAQRRRFAVAAAITVIVVPTFLLLGRNEELPASSGVGTVAPTISPNAASASPGDNDEQGTDEVTDDAMGELAPGFVTGESIYEDDEIPTIVYPNNVEVLALNAEFSGTISTADRCYVPGAPSGERVTIANVDNGRVVDCYNSASVPEGELAVLNTSAFTQIADLTDSPVPVEVTW